MEARASSLNANDAFLLRTPGGRGFLWVGRGASGEEEKGAQYISEKLVCNSKRIAEGEEPGKAPDPRLSGGLSIRPFTLSEHKQCSVLRGRYTGPICITFIVSCL